MQPDLRIAVLADAHGNAFALEAVLKDMRLNAPDVVVNLGDQVWGRADPARAYLLQSQLNAVEVMGNNEQKLSWQPEQLGLQGNAFRQWLVALLPSEATTHLAELPLTATLGDGAVFATHGTPQDANQELLWGWRPDGWMMRAPRQLRQLLTGIDVEVVVVGHTHREGITKLDDRLLVSAGSVGWQIDGDPRARWVLIERRRENWHVAFKRVIYDWAAAAHHILERDPTAHEEAEIYLTGDDPGDFTL